MIGFGRALAVATFLYDYDCVGNSGSNMGYTIGRNGEAKILKIDAGEALPFLEDLKEIARKGNMIIGTGGTKIMFKQLTTADKK